MVGKNKKTKKLQQSGPDLRKTKKKLQVSESRYQRLFETARDGILILDAKTGEIFDVNPFLTELLGCSRKEFLGKHLWEIGFLENTASSKSAFLKLKKKGYVRYENLPLQTKNGKSIEVEFVSNAYRVDGKEVIQCNIRDITDRKATEDTLKKYSEEITDLYHNAPCGYHSLGPDGTFLRINNTEAQWLGYAQDEIVEKKKWSDLLAPNSLKVFQNTFPVFKKQGWIHDLEFELVRKDGSTFWVLLNATAVKDAAGNFVMSRSTIFDITQRKQMEEEIRALSLTDDLTNLYNRRGFFTLAEQQLRIANRAKKEMFLLYADLDNMKWINDRFGHQEGDVALTNVADIIKTTFRESDIVARIGGDEFVVLVTETAVESKKILMARLQKNLKISNSKTNREYKLSLSTGIVFCNPQEPHPCSLNELIAKADKLMYEEKITKRKM